MLQKQQRLLLVPRCSRDMQQYLDMKALHEALAYNLLHLLTFTFCLFVLLYLLLHSYS